MAGYIEIDFTPLKETGQIKLQPPARPGMFPYWKVEAILKIIVSGRNLRYEVLPPSGDGEAHGVGQTCIAAAFRPGAE
jgi:hypothetical protein